MVAVLERTRRTRPGPRLPPRDGARERLPTGGGSGPRRDWPLVPAVLVVVLLAAFLTWLGMYTQILANLAGAQLPGS